MEGEREERNAVLKLQSQKSTKKKITKIGEALQSKQNQSITTAFAVPTAQSPLLHDAATFPCSTDAGP